METCRFCGVNDLHWIQTDIGWRLATPAGQVHRCQEYKSRRAPEDSPEAPVASPPFSAGATGKAAGGGSAPAPAAPPGIRTLADLVEHTHWKPGDEMGAFIIGAIVLVADPEDSRRARLCYFDKWGNFQGFQPVQIEKFQRKSSL